MTQDSNFSDEPKEAIAGLAGQQGTADGTNNSARFNSPSGVAVDLEGNLYVADSFNDTIRKIMPVGTNWVVTTLAGDPGVSSNGAYVDGTGTDALFFKPYGVAVDTNGNVYVTDSQDFAVRKLTPEGTVTTLAGLVDQFGLAALGSADGTNRTAAFAYTLGIAVDHSGNLYVADGADGSVSSDISNNSIRKLTPVGADWVVSTIAGLAGGAESNSILGYGTDGANSNARFNQPSGIAVDVNGNIYVADTANNTIRKTTPAGVVTTVAGMAGVPQGFANGTGSSARFYAPAGVAVDADDNVYVADTYNNTIRKITPLGATSTLAGLAGTETGFPGSADGTNHNARFDLPGGIAVDSLGNLYVADTGNSTIRKVTPVGTNWVVTTIAGLAGDPSFADGADGNARFSSPQGVAVDKAGNLYVADTENNAIRKVTPAGTNWVVATLAGSPGVQGSADGQGTNALFSLPQAIAAGAAGDIFVADTGNDTVRQLTPAGFVQTMGGVAGYQSSADGTGSGARFFHPGGITVATNGTLYVADTSNNTIRVGQIAIPSLHIVLSANQIVLYWPQAVSGKVLVTSDTLFCGDTWVPVSNAVATVGINFVVTNTITDAAAFYRLQ